MDERQFFTEKPEQRPARFQCPRCRRTNDYSIRWLRRTRKAQVPGGADARDRAMFEKVKDHLVRVDDDVGHVTVAGGLRHRARDRRENQRTVRHEGRNPRQSRDECNHDAGQRDRGRQEKLESS